MISTIISLTSGEAAGKYLIRLIDLTGLRNSKTVIFVKHNSLDVNLEAFILPFKGRV